MQRLLLVEDDAAFRELLSLHLEDAGYQVEVVATLAAARVALGRNDALLLDQRLPDGGGIDFLAEVHEQRPDLPVIMITGLSDTGLSDTDLAIAAIKAGAYDFIRKPVDTTALDATLRNALHSHNLARKIKFVAESTRVGLDSIVGVSQAMLEVCKTIGRVAPTQACVLISGESGTGKEVVARAIHSHSDRHGLFLPINCSAIVETLLENELFGHEKGSYTGAVATKAGKFELAQDGTLFLDEIGDLPLPLQAKLLRVLQEGGFERVGGNHTLNCNARIVAATHRDLVSMVAQQSFREDLYYRLNGLELKLPALRERSDRLLLIRTLLAAESDGVNIRIAEDAFAALNAYSWPGNIRQLRNILRTAAALCEDRIIRLEDLPAEITGMSLHCSTQNALGYGAALTHVSGGLAQAEREALLQELDQHHWNITNTAARLGFSRNTLYRKMRKHGIQPREYPVP